MSLTNLPSSIPAGTTHSEDRLATGPSTTLQFTYAGAPGRAAGDTGPLRLDPACSTCPQRGRVAPYDGSMSTVAADMPWDRLHRRARREFWGWLVAALVATAAFCGGWPYHDALPFAVMLLLPLVSLRQAWRADRLLRAADDRLQSGMATNTENAQIATFAAGCFWGVEELFRTVPGVLATRVGYTSGNTVDPTYEQVCTGRTNHAEALEVTFDPSRVTYPQLLELFFENHDPTTLNRQGPDVGTQYRSGVYYHSDEQRHLAEAELEKRQKSGDYPRPIVTEVVEASPFYAAEEYHQKYFAHRGIGHSCHFGNGKRRKVGAER